MNFPAYSSLILSLFFLQNVFAQNTFEKDIENYAKSINLPGVAVGVVKNGKLTFFKAIGKADSARTENITADHIFGIASVTKSFTSVLLQKMEAEGKLKLNDPIDKFSNKYFTKERWNSKTTLAHIISQTSESEPIGQNFTYNGSKYNLVYNALSTVYNLPDSNGVYRSFCVPIEEKILNPLHMNHTLARYKEQDFDTLKKWIVCPIAWNDKDSVWQSQPVNIKKMQSGPGFGMMSSINDLVKYSNALDENTLISKERFQKITTPFYSGSPYGMGWFVHDFEGIKMYWAYGYGNNDASILLKIPSENLTLIVLSTSSLISESTRMGYGNPLNSPMIISFLRNFLKNKSSNFNKKLAIEEKFSQSEIQLFAPNKLANKREEAVLELINLSKNSSNASIWFTPTAFELLSKSNNPQLMNFALVKYKKLKKFTQIHPAILFYTGEIAGKLGKKQEQIKIYTKLSAGENSKEQSYKLDAMFWMGKYYRNINKLMANKYLERLIRYKENTSSLDSVYQEAKVLLRE